MHGFAKGRHHKASRSQLWVTRHGSMHVTVENDVFVDLIGYDHNRSVRGDVRQGIEISVLYHGSGGVMREVHHDGPRAIAHRISHLLPIRTEIRIVLGGFAHGYQYRYPPGHPNGWNIGVVSRLHH